MTVTLQPEEDAAELVEQARAARSRTAGPSRVITNCSGMMTMQERHIDEDEEQRAEDHCLGSRRSQRHGIELEPVVDQPVAEALGDDLLDGLDLLVAELDDLAGADVDQVVVVLVGDQLEAGAAVLEIVLGDEPGFLEQVEGAVDGRQRDARDRSRWARR